jgi:UDP-N-acetylglucosamine/UDP-N-acetylgalactosamine diphosphorylase
MTSGIVERLIAKGVEIPNPEMVTVGEEVDVDRVSANGVVLFPGCRITGASTLILDHVRIGTGGPAVLENCRVGAGTELSAGVFNKSVFLGKNRVGPGAHFREGTILEEAASAAHTVGLKQTILFPWVTLGSLINFCDCLMAGGTGPADHSEVGSSYVHFNFTPNQDKATPSLIGDVPRGVMLDRSPIFLGGQGGMVGPCRVEYGTVAASGTILRKDLLKPGQIAFEAPRRSFTAPNIPGLYRNLKRIVASNLLYIANLKALEAWYRHFRPHFAPEPMGPLLIEELLQVLSANVAERIRRMGQLVEKLPESLALYRKLMGDGVSAKVEAQKTELIQQWPRLADRLLEPTAEFESQLLRERFLAAAEQGRAPHTDYLQGVSGLSRQARALGTGWLQAVVDQVLASAAGELETLAPGLPSPGGTGTGGLR